MEVDMIEDCNQETTIKWTIYYSWNM